MNRRHQNRSVLDKQAKMRLIYVKIYSKFFMHTSMNFSVAQVSLDTPDYLI